jgi:N-acetylneuraminic acid mutarotase
VPREPIESQIHCFNLQTNTWEDLNIGGDIPAPRLAHTAVAIGDSIYVFGGRGATYEDIDELYQFNTSSCQWKKITSTNTPPARSYHAAVAIGTKMYVFAGCGANKCRYNDLHEFDTITQEWKQLSNEESINAPDVRGGPALCPMRHNNKNYLFLFGGFKGHQMGDSHAFDIEKGEWEPIVTNQELPEPRSVHCMASLSPTDLFLFGGEKEASNLGHLGGGKYYSNTFVFDATNYTWKQIHATGDIPSPRAWLVGSAFSDNGVQKVCIFGGFDGTDRLSDMFIFQQ